MSKQLDQHEAEAVITLRGSNEAAWNTLISYYSRRYDFERDQCVDVDDEKKMKLAQGRARAFREMSKIEATAEDVLEAVKEKYLVR